jgi:phosphatidylglycerophosphate synthase
MPEPISKHSINGYLAYPFANYLATKLCGKISANTITYINSILSCYIIFIMINYPCQYKKIFVLTWIRAFLDILDGAIARKCKETSEFGSKLDKTTDFIFEISLLITFVYHCVKNPDIKKSIYFKPILTICLIIIFLGWYESINKFPGYWQDNDIILKPLIYTCFSYLASNCGKTT